jgi:hypothetical protein
MGRKRNDASGPFDFRGCDLTAECLPATEEVRVRFPAAAPIPRRLRVSTQQSLQISAHSGQHRGSLPGQNPKSEGRSPKETPSPKPEGLHSRAELLGFGTSRFPRISAFGFRILLGAWQRSDAPALQAGSSRSVTGRPPPFHCGKLDQCTERSLINFFRWV